MKEEEGEVIDRGSTEVGPRVKTEEGELVDCDSTAGGPHGNGKDFRRVYRLRRYARLRSCFLNDTGDLIS